MDEAKLKQWMQETGFVPDGKGGFHKPKRTVSDLRPTASTKPEPVTVCQRNEGVARKAIYPGRVRISITSYVCGALRDEDNICPKFFIDMLRHVGLIRDDCPGVIELDKIKETRVPTKQKEGCEIVITPL